MNKLVLIRHGQSEWNKENRFTGWKDIDLSEQGREEAREAIYGMTYEEWKRRHQAPATPEQLARMDASVALNKKD